MADELLKFLAPERFEVESAGIEPGKLNPLVVQSLKDYDINIEGKATQSVKEMIDQGKTYDYVITVCDETSAERCPVFPGDTKRIHWSFTDPSQFQGSDEERLSKIKDVREEIKTRLEQWIKTEDT